jgi:ribosomal protein S18 acetylase RimI-like enzyme
MTSTPVQIESRHDMSIIDIDRLEDRLYDHNRRATGSDDGKGLAFVAIDAQGTQIGAVAGYSWARMAEIKQLWVDEAARDRGLGRSLLEAAVAEALVRGCQSVWVMSYDFQAPNFYERLGFRREAELADWPPGHTQVILRRRLQEETA